MRILLLTIILASFCTACSAQMPKDWQNSLKPKGTPAKQMVFADKGKTKYRIVIPQNANDAQKKAAAIISSRFEQISGAAFPIVSEGPGFKPSGYEISISDTNLLKTSGIKRKNLGKEGYAIDVRGNRLFIYGGGLRGAISGAYSLLEEDLGCRWYALGSNDIPKMKTLAFKPVCRTVVPKLDIRDPFYLEAWETNWSLRNKTNAPYATIPKNWGGNSKYSWFVHSYARIFDPSVDFATHPEYFAEIKGKRQPSQLCVTNPDVIKEGIEKARDCLKFYPDCNIISISPNDGRGYCECANCSAIDKAEGSKSGSMIFFINKIADALKDEFPDATFMSLAYLDTFYPPKNLRPSANVAVQLCTDSHAWKYQFCHITESTEFQSAMKAWAAINAKIYIWDYPCDYVHWLVPMANMPVWQKNIQFYMANNARGIMLQGDSMSYGCDMAEMRSWVWSKQLWDPNLDTKKLMKDFILGYYKEAAVPVWNYNMLMWNFWEKYHALPHKCGVKSDNPLMNNLQCSYAPDGPMFTPEFMDKSWQYITQAEKLAKSEDMLQRIQKIKVSLLYLKLSQGIGYFSEFRDFIKGKDIKGGALQNKEAYKKLYDEFVSICRKCNITSLSEMNVMSKSLDKWEAALTATGVAPPSKELSNDWGFITDPDNKGIKEEWFNNTKFYKPAKAENAFGGGTATQGIDADGMSRVRSNAGFGWEKQGFPDYVGFAWYFQTFTVPKEFLTAKHLYILFGAVDEEAWVYLNGKMVCERSVASTGQPVSVLWSEPFLIDAAQYLNKDGENRLAVRVFNGLGMGGIWKPVTLYAVDRPYTAGELTF